MAFDQKKFWLQMGASQMEVIGKQMQRQDTNKTGVDDAVGSMLAGGSGALFDYADGKLKDAESSLLSVADGIYRAFGYDPVERE
jgi:hypothetical protein